MPREIERQSDRFAGAPHLEDLPDSAYRSRSHLPAGPDDYNERTRRHEPDPDEYEQPDEASGYNWGPPPAEHHLHDPGFREAGQHDRPWERTEWGQPMPKSTHDSLADIGRQMEEAYGLHQTIPCRGCGGETSHVWRTNDDTGYEDNQCTNCGGWWQDLNKDWKPPPISFE